MFKLLLIFTAALVLADRASAQVNRIKLNPNDKYDVETTQYLTNINNAINTVSQNVTSPSLYYMILNALKSIRTYKSYIPCIADIATVLNATRSGLSEMWALQMIDSGTKLPSGILAGNIVDLGQYDECINAQGYNITGQHCLINFAFHLPHVKDNSALSMVGGSLTLTMAQCFPATCEPYMLRDAFSEISYLINEEIVSYNVTLSIDIPDTDCHTLYSRQGPDALDITILVIVAVLLVIVSSMTVVDYMLLSKLPQDKPQAKGILAVKAFSAYTNGRKLFSLEQNPTQMNCLNGMKFLSIGWVALGHRYRYAVTVPLVNLLRVPQMIETWSKMVILNAILSVDTFFLISGLLNAYGFCTLRDKIKGFAILNVIQTYIHRYIRLTPAYLLMIGITATWIYRTGDGPLWDRFVGYEKDNCRQSFWANLVYLNNYLTPDNNCMMQSWYLAADMQMFWVSPFVIYPLWRWPIFGYFYILLLTAVSVAAPALVAYFYDIRTPIPIDTDPVKESEEMDKLYFPTHTKTVAYVIGILVGYFMYRIRVKKNLKIRLSKAMNLIFWILAMLSMLYALFGGHYLYLSSEPYTLVESSLYIGFFRLFWAIGVAWVIFACASGYGGLINSFLSLSIFGPLGRLSYCIYLTHIFMIVYKFGSMRTAIYLSDYDMVQESLGEMFFILIFATSLSLVTESPIMTLEKLILGGGGGRNRGRRQENSDAIRKKTDEDTNNNDDTNGSPIRENSIRSAVNVEPSAPVEKELEPSISYPQLPDISTVEEMSVTVDDVLEPPPYNPNNIYAQVVKNRTYSVSSSGPV